ncbi:MAG: class IV adenylate cyclase [Archaeoglobaceae archaeon]
MEVEAKFPYREGVEEKVREIAELVVEKLEEDVYFSHPCRDFAASDEALRLRRDVEGVKLTYKGPKVDVETKSREEVNVGVEDFERAKLLLLKLGFREFARVRKLRKIYRLGDAIVCIDDVEGLGRFVEVEVEGGIEKKEKVFEIAASLGYARDESITKSYLEMLMERRRLRR